MATSLVLMPAGSRHLASAACLALHVAVAVVCSCCMRMPSYCCCILWASALSARSTRYTADKLHTAAHSHKSRAASCCCFSYHQIDEFTARICKSPLLVGGSNFQLHSSCLSRCHMRCYLVCHLCCACGVSNDIRFASHILKSCYVRLVLILQEKGWLFDLQSFPAAS
jgi:hypothetical protein